MSSFKAAAPDLRLYAWARAQIEHAGIACPAVAGVGTGTRQHERDSGVYTELQPGSYGFVDRGLLQLCAVRQPRCVRLPAIGRVVDGQRAALKAAPPH